MPFLELKIFQDLVEKLPDAIVIVNKSGEIRAANTEAADLFGYPYGALDGKPLNLLIPTKSKEKHKEYVKMYFSNPQKRHMADHRVVKAVRQDGNEFEIDIILAPCHIQGELYTVASCRKAPLSSQTDNKLSKDIHKKELIIEELEKFNYTISHDLKAPLKKVEGLVDLLLSDVEQGRPVEELQQTAHFIRESLKSMTELITAVLNEAQSEHESGKITIEDVIAELKKLIIIPSNFQFKINCKNTFVVGNKIQLVQVLLNLINNAIKYNDKEAGKIELSCRELNGMYEFCIADNGQGIAEDKLKSIFNIFEKDKNSNTSSYGIGLATVKHIVEQKGGEVSAQSKLGLGTDIRFTWPLG